MEGLMPTFDVNGGNNGCGDGWGNWGGALIGGAIGAWAGSAWNGNRWNNGGCGGGGCGDQYIMDTLTTMRTDINSIGRDNLMQTANLNASLCSGFGNAVAATQAVGADLARGQCRTEAAVLTTGLQGQIQQKDNTIFQLNAAHNAEVQGMRNTFELKSSIDGCCCATNANIKEQGCQTREVLLAEGCATRATIRDEQDKTRALISQLDRERLLRESAAKDAKIAQLEAQSFNTGLAAATQQQCRNDMNAMMGNIIGHMAVIAGNRTTPTTAAAA